MKGVLVFHSETGTEGGWYAFQDEKFMGIPDDTENCAKCGYMRKYVEEEEAAGREIIPSSESLKYGLGICNYADHEWKLLFPKGRSSYEGLHMLKDGDHLRIRQPDTYEILWQGNVLFTRNTDLYTEDSQAHVHGMWVNQEPNVGVDRETWAEWFISEYPADLNEGRD